MSDLTLFDVDALDAPPIAAEPDAAGTNAMSADASAPAPVRAAPAGRRLTAAQAAAVAERSHSLLLSASAGSGKTSVLVERFVAAVLEDGVEPSRILAITFTDKAAGELRERLRRAFDERGAREAARATESAFVSTIHGFCSRLLRAHPLAAGLDPGFTVLDEPRAARLREEAFATALRGFLDAGGREALDLAAAYRADGLAGAITGIHDELRSQGQAEPRLPPVDTRLPPDAERAALADARAALAAELASARDGKLVDEARAALDRCARFLEDVEAGVVPWPGRLKALEITTGRASVLSTEVAQAYVDAHEAFRQACADHHAARHVALLDDLLARYGAAYAAAKAARGALDFDDLELRARDLLRDHPAVRAAWRERFVLVMVDEFQDTNRRQLELLRAIEDDDVFAVGDEFQSIYGFRHADVDIFRERREALAERGLALRLDESFRSRPEILAAVNAAFAPRFGEHFAPLRAGREHPPADDPAVELLVTDGRGWDAEDDPVALGESLPPGPAWRRAEARLLAQRLRELVDAGVASPGEMAVLVRAAGSMPVFEQALADVGLPTLASAGRGFWTRQEVVDLMSYLAALANPLDEPALLVVLGSPLCGASADALALVVRAAREASAPLWRTVRDDRGPWRAALDGADAARLEAFAERFAAERAAARRRSLDELLDRAIAASGYDLHVLGLLGGPRRMANVDKLLRLARAYEAAEGRDLRGFVDHAGALEQAAKREPEAAVDDPEVDAVRLMTVHAAKGLEFDVVAVADLGRKPNLSSSTLLVEGGRVGLRLAMLDGAPSTPSLDHRRLEEARREREAAEEERILYVALTRARRRLLLSGATDRWSNGRSAAPLTWLGPALVPDLPARFEAVDAEHAVEVVAGDGFDVRVTISTPATVGAALRPELAAPAGPRTEVAPPAPVVDLPARPTAPAPPPRTDTLSYSALRDYARCGLRFRARRVLRLAEQDPPPGVLGDAVRVDGGGLDARQRGVVVHALLEELDLQAPAPPSPERVAELAVEAGGEAQPPDVAAAQRLVAAFVASATGERLMAARRVRRERSFAFAVGGPAEEELPLVTGVIDALGVEADGGWLVVDFKTDPLDGGGAPDLAGAGFAGEYRVQRLVYALAALRAGAPRVEVAHLFLEDAEHPVTATFAAEDAPALTAELRALMEPLLRGEHPLTAHPHAGLCATCPARDGLCPYPRELTLRADPDPPVAAGPDRR